MTQENTHIFLATLGQRPEAITITLDMLLQRYPIQHIGIIHTDPLGSGIVESLRALEKVIASDYPQIELHRHTLLRSLNQPLLDIVDQTTAEEYRRGVTNILRQYQDKDYTMHFLVSGGRKAMSIYAVLAAAIVFGPYDTVWTILSPTEVISEIGMFHLTDKWKNKAQLVELPLPTRVRGRATSDAILVDTSDMFIYRDKIRAELLQEFSAEEKHLVLHLETHPYVELVKVAEMLQKEERTIQNQLRNIYAKMFRFLNLHYPDLGYNDETTNKKQVLMDILHRREVKPSN